MPRIYLMISYNKKDALLISRANFIVTLTRYLCYHLQANQRHLVYIYYSPSVSSGLVPNVYGGHDPASALQPILRVCDVLREADLLCDV